MKPSASAASAVSSSSSEDTTVLIREKVKSSNVSSSSSSLPFSLPTSTTNTASTSNDETTKTTSTRPAAHIAAAIQSNIRKARHDSSHMWKILTMFGFLYLATYFINSVIMAAALGKQSQNSEYAGLYYFIPAVATLVIGGLILSLRAWNFSSIESKKYQSDDIKIKNLESEVGEYALETRSERMFLGMTSQLSGSTMCSDVSADGKFLALLLKSGVVVVFSNSSDQQQQQNENETSSSNFYSNNKSDDNFKKIAELCGDEIYFSPNKSDSAELEEFYALRFSDQLSGSIRRNLLVCSCYLFSRGIVIFDLDDDFRKIRLQRLDEKECFPSEPCTRNHACFALDFSVCHDNLLAFSSRKDPTTASSSSSISADLDGNNTIRFLKLLTREEEEKENSSSSENQEGGREENKNNTNNNNNNNNNNNSAERLAAVDNDLNEADEEEANWKTILNESANEKKKWKRRKNLDELFTFTVAKEDETRMIFYDGKQARPEFSEGFCNNSKHRISSLRFLPALKTSSSSSSSSSQKQHQNINVNNNSWYQPDQNNNNVMMWQKQQQKRVQNQQERIAAVIDHHTRDHDSFYDSVLVIFEYSSLSPKRDLYDPSNLEDRNSRILHVFSHIHWTVSGVLRRSPCGTLLLHSSNAGREHTRSVKKTGGGGKGSQTVVMNKNKGTFGRVLQVDLADYENSQQNSIQLFSETYKSVHFGNLFSTSLGHSPWSPACFPRAAGGAQFVCVAEQDRIHLFSIQKSQHEAFEIQRDPIECDSAVTSLSFSCNQHTLLAGGVLLKSPTLEVKFKRARILFVIREKSRTSANNRIARDALTLYYPFLLIARYLPFEAMKK